MKTDFFRVLSVLSAAVVAASLLALAGPSWAQSSISFGKSLLQGETSGSPTSLQFGPDGQLYVAQLDGTVKAYTIARNGPDNYAVTATKTITSIKSIPNHNDDGALNSSVTTRQVTGLMVTGTASNPVIYVSSSDPRTGGGADGGVGDSDKDTNSGIVSRLTWNGSGWDKFDVIRGLPRSERQHAANGMQLDEATNTLYLAMGGNTNTGAPSTNFALMPEYALSAAILSIDLDAIGNTTYNLPTLNDEDRAGSPDTGDPFGGNDGKNQARIVPGGPVQVYASGFRNPYDVLISESSGKMYTVDNGSNGGWGDVPVNEGPDGNCTNQQNEPGDTTRDTLHLLSQGYYGGFPNPTRGNKANTFNATNPQSPVSTANPAECDYRAPGSKGELASFGASTNGLDEYTSSKFGGVMDGDLLAAGYNSNEVRRIKLNAAGSAVVSNEVLFSAVGTRPLDVTAQSDAGPFPGTIWVADIATSNIVAFEPKDSGGSCTGADDPALDEDGDGFDNADEIDNGTDPCSSADAPPDYDGDKTSNLNDPDDDNDTQPDTSDPFAIDKDNGKSTNLPVNYTWDNEDAPGGLLNLGFTGLMTNKTSDYEALYDPENMTAGGAAGVVTVDKVPAGSANNNDTQKYGFQFGVNATANTGTFTAHTQINAPFAGITPQNNQSMGLFIGNGDQDNYVKLVVHANSGVGGIQLAKEVSGSSTQKKVTEPMPGPEAVDLYLTVDPAAGAAQPSYSVTENGVIGPRKNLGGPTAVPAGWFGGANGLAVGIISTSSGPGPEFPASWDFIEVVPDGATTPTGLAGQYYDNKDLTDLKLTRTDPTVNFDWGAASPDPSIGADTFSTRWSGMVKADHGETYTFYTTANDGVRLWVNGQLIINRWKDGSQTNSGNISLQAGQWYEIKMEHYEGINSAKAKLEYSSPSTPRQIVPTDHLKPTTP